MTGEERDPPLVHVAVKDTDLPRVTAVGGPVALHQLSERPDTPERPGRAVRRSESGSTWDGLIPKARRSCGVAT